MCFLSSSISIIENRSPSAHSSFLTIREHAQRNESAARRGQTLSEWHPLEREPQRKLNLSGILRREDSSKGKWLIRERVRQIEICAIERVEGLSFGGQPDPFAERKCASQGEVRGKEPGSPQNIAARVAPCICWRDRESGHIEPLLRSRVGQRGAVQDVGAVDSEITPGIARVAVVGRKFRRERLAALSRDDATELETAHPARSTWDAVDERDSCQVRNIVAGKPPFEPVVMAVLGKVLIR